MRRLSILGLGLLLAGCGGGGGSQTADSGTDPLPGGGITQTFGPVSVRFTGAQPVVGSAALQTGTVSWATGSQFLEARATLLPTQLSDRTLDARVVGLVSGVPVAKPLAVGGIIDDLTASARPFVTTFQSADPKGRYLLVDDQSESIVRYDLFADTREVLGIPNGHLPRWSPSGDRFAYISGSGSATKLHVRYRANVGDRIVPNTDGVTHFDWDSEGKFIVEKFDFDQNASEYDSINLDGTNSQFVVEVSARCLSMSCSNVPGAFIEINRNPDTGKNGAIMFTYGTGGTAVVDLSAVLPAESQLTVNRHIEPGTFLLSTEGDKTYILRPRQSSTLFTTGLGDSTVMLPRPTERLFVGDTGWPTRASGVFYGSSATGIGSMVSWQATPDASASVMKLDVNADSSIGVFQITGDAIPALTYAASLTAPTATVIRKGSTPIGGAIVTVNGVGNVTSLVTLGQQARGSSPRVRREGSRIVIEGSIVGAFSGGKNEAPGGASRVEIDAITGKFVSAA